MTSMFSIAPLKKFGEEVLVAAKAAPKIYFAPLAGAASAVSALWKRPQQ
ncbi:hypothetical protein [Pseudomonas sp. GOM6]|nr:hypothetical protein [Pseudomonas sp. GOM6]MDG1580907.1 hypothetical protein [Pseudomonas sp. GOM6]